MTIERALTGLTKSASATYVEDVFSTYLYTGTGASQTITNGIDLSTKGGMVWMKCRSGTAADHAIYDTARGATFDIASNLATAQTTQSTGLTAFGTSGFTIGSLAKINTSANTYVSWTFRKQPKFFDIVTYTGNGANRTISHNLGATPGMIIVKQLDGANANIVYHAGQISAVYYTLLNGTSAQATAATVWNSTAPTSSVFSVGTDATVNASGGTYVAYLFAASNSGGFGAAGTDSIVACGNYGGSSSAATTVNLGWEPQFILLKNVTTSTTNWFILDNMRGIASKDTIELFANTTGNDAADTSSFELTSTGFKVTAFGSTSVNAASNTYIYMAIRRGPMKKPTDATKVFSPITSSGTQGTKLTTGFPVDTSITTSRTGADSNRSVIVNRVRGINTGGSTIPSSLLTTSTAGEAAGSVFAQGWDNTSIQVPTYFSNVSTMYLNFARAPGFHDVVLYTGTGANTTISHNLGVTPELLIVKKRSAASTTGWYVWHSALANTERLLLNTSAAKSTDATAWNSTSPTSSVFSLGTNADGNASGATYVALLFATCSGVSKVGSYTGTGAAQNINCGFAAGARFVMIKRIDVTGDWYVWDSARGINASGSYDPYILYDSSAAEVTATDYLATFSSGFGLTSTAPAALNASGGTYLYLAIA